MVSGSSKNQLNHIRNDDEVSHPIFAQLNQKATYKNDYLVTSLFGQLKGKGGGKDGWSRRVTFSAD